MEITAPSRWRCIDFISDIHLHHGDHATFATWRAYVRATPADALFILGDLFEVWVGDDALDLDLDPGFEAQCVDVLHEASQRLDLYIMAGNRDFLMGSALMQACKATLLEDPCILSFGGERALLTHGDALCLADTDYQQFRAMVRSAQWQTKFLARPLPERQAIARGIRAQSESHKQAGTSYADVDTDAATAMLAANACQRMVHGHTHRPGIHALGNNTSRTVLSDWVSDLVPPRGDVLRLTLRDTGPAHWSRLSPASASSSPD